jgi:2-amino-4-hydroxy-6-hydroxymethyldihydropteridine diphosphokinase
MIMIQYEVVFSLGSNLGDRKFFIEEMEKSLAEIIVPPIKRSRLMETAPVDIIGQQNWYLNRIIAGFFSGTPRGLLEQTQLIERRLGRTEKGNRAPRTADIDLLLFDNQVVKEDDLVLPHPAIHLRRFCIEGLFEVVPDKMIAGINSTVTQLFSEMAPEIREQRIEFL